MTINDVRIRDVGGHNTIPTRQYPVQAGAGAIAPGEPVKVATAGANYVTLSADAEPVTGTPTFAGIAKSASTQTASADGVVDVYMPLPGVIYEAKAKSAAAADTAAEITALINKRVPFDLTSGSWTVDTAASDASTNGLIIVGGDPTTSTIYFMVKQACLSVN